MPFKTMRPLKRYRNGLEIWLDTKHDVVLLQNRYNATIKMHGKNYTDVYFHRAILVTLIRSSLLSQNDLFLEQLVECYKGV